MYRHIVTLLLISLVAHVDAARVSSRFFDASIVETMEEKLQKDCGRPCIRMFQDMMGWLEDNAEAVSTGKIGPVNGSLTHMNVTHVTKEPWGLALLALTQREAQKVCCPCWL
jgi:hypothetical protein